MAVEELQAQVAGWLNTLFSGVEELSDGSFHVPNFGTSAIDVHVEEVFGGRHTRVRVDAYVLMEVPITTKLMKYIGERSNDFVFGHLAVIRDEEAETGTLVFRQTLLGDAIDEVELKLACQVTALTADNLDEDLIRNMGGRLYVDD